MVPSRRIMKLTEATIVNHKSIANPIQLAVDDRITVMIGKSESGKTNVLHATRMALGSQPYSDDDYCSWIAKPSDATVMTWLTFKLEDDEVAALGVGEADQTIRVGRRR